VYVFISFCLFVVEEAQLLWSHFMLQAESP